MEEIILNARHLAESILSSDTFKKLRDIEDQVIADPEARELTERYEQASLNLRQKEQAMEPISPEEKRTILELRSQVAENAKLQRLREAQGAYYALMEAVNGTIHSTLDAGFKGERGEEGAAQTHGPESPAGDDPATSRIILP